MDELVSDLNTLLRYETASLMQFMGEATPYVHPGMLRAWQTVQKMASRASGRAARLTALLTSRRWPALPTVHDSDVAGLQYSRLEALLPRLVQEATQNVAMIEQAIAHAASDADITAALTEMLEEHRAELAALEGCVVPAS